MPHGTAKRSLVRTVIVLLAVLAAMALPVPVRAQSTPPAAQVQVSSPSAVLMEASSGQVLYAKGAHERRHPASVTKIMTLLVAYDAVQAGQIKPEDMVTTSEAAASLGGTTAFLEQGEAVTVADLLRAVAIGSANDAAVALAEHVAGSHAAFVELMNQKGRELGMNDTQFRNATGFDAEGHFTSAYDVALMSRFIVASHPEVLRLTSVFLDSMKHPDGRETELLNRNRLVKFYPGGDGLKTGWTGVSGYSISATAQRRGTRMIAVVLGAPDAKTRQADAWALLDYGFAQYTTLTLLPADRQAGRVPVVLGAAYDAVAVPARPFTATVRKSDQKKVELQVQLAPRVRAPVRRGDRLGRAVAVAGGQAVAEVPLVAAADVPRLSLGGALKRALGAVFSLGRRSS